MQTALIKTIRTMSQTDDFIPVENITKNLTSLEQYAETVLNYSSRYNFEITQSYAPDNLVGKYLKYPSYGDFPETYHLRTYGKWWQQSEAYQKEYMPQDVDPLGAEDFVTLRFQSAVVPRDVCIYETYNPGAVVRIWGRFTGHSWKLLWEGPPQQCPDQSRKFHPVLRKSNYLINEVRLEFNQSHLKYHTSIDAVLLGGFQPKFALHYNLLQRDFLDWTFKTNSQNKMEVEDSEEVNEDKSTLFAFIPYEILVHIFQYLDLMSLCRCAQVNKTWNAATHDSLLYQNLSLKRYWNRVNGETLHYYGRRCQWIKKVDLSWCGNDDTAFRDQFKSLLQLSCKKLTHLSLCHCEFVNNNILQEISEDCEDIVDLRLRNTRPDPRGFRFLSHLTKLVALDLSSTNINDDSMIDILVVNPSLKHINLDLCSKLVRLDQVIEVATRCNRNLTTWSSWKTNSLTAVGASYFAEFPNLKELDLGWCLMVSPPADCLEKIANHCSKLQRLVISEWRGTTDQTLLPIITKCRDLTQLDLLGIMNITPDICETALLCLTKLELLEISFCESISNEQVSLWRHRYPHITIQRSCQHVVTDYLN